MRLLAGIKTLLAGQVTNLLLWDCCVCLRSACASRMSRLAGPGLEPGVAGYEPAVLPLHHPATLAHLRVFFALLYIGIF